MNREQAKQLLPIIQAFADGADVQYRSDFGWTTATSPAFSVPGEWRIKPEPLEGWAIGHGTGTTSVYADKKFVESMLPQFRDFPDARIVHMVEVTE